MASLLKKYEQRASNAGVNAYTSQARTWFLSNVYTLTRANRNRLLRDSEAVKSTGFISGSMFMFIYDPKGKKTLPYYDKFPLSIMLGPSKGGFTGINLHYLRPRTRALFLEKLLEYTNNNFFDETTKFNVTYQLLKSVARLKEFKPRLKKYLYTQVRSNFMEVPAEYWETAIFLPTEQFAKADKSSVFTISAREY